ncbi:MAG TPA: LLM class F420-dependent oxidoreductase [Candidatus Dormibacteraeota bacterium]|jgi:probable F420-dependent oxidoreductase
MDLGIALPVSAPYASPEAIVEVAQAAEKLGYTAVWTFERLLYALGDVPQPGGPARPLPETYKSVYEPIETLSFVAARTTTVRLGTSVLDAPLHTPVMLARRLATLDRFSNGRVIAGLGLGWMEQEYATANVPMARRGARFEEGIKAMRAAWGPDPVSFEGEFYTIPPSLIDPKPVQQGIPVVIAAIAPRAIERAGRIGDGFNPIGFSVDRLRELVGAFRQAAADAGRDPAQLPVMVRANVGITEQAAGDGRQFLGGSPGQVAADLAALRELDIDHVLFRNHGARSLEHEIEIMGSLQEAYSRS